MPDARPFSHHGIYPILDRNLCDQYPLDAMTVLHEWFNRFDFTIVQLRGKQMTTRQWFDWAAPLVQRIQEAGKSAIINDRTDIALLTSANGVHLGQNDLLVPDARNVLGPEAMIGLSTHNDTEIRMANTLQPDYLGFGPIYPTGTKTDTHSVQGLARLKTACASTNLPIVAIGGITLGRLEEVLGAGAQCGAMIGALVTIADDQ